MHLVQYLNMPLSIHIIRMPYLLFKLTLDPVYCDFRTGSLTRTTNGHFRSPISGIRESMSTRDFHFEVADEHSCSELLCILVQGLTSRPSVSSIELPQETPQVTDLTLKGVSLTRTIFEAVSYFRQSKGRS